MKDFLQFRNNTEQIVRAGFFNPDLIDQFNLGASCAEIEKYKNNLKGEHDGNR